MMQKKKLRELVKGDEFTINNVTSSFTIVSSFTITEIHPDFIYVNVNCSDGTTDAFDISWFDEYVYVINKKVYPQRKERKCT